MPEIRFLQNDSSDPINEGPVIELVQEMYEALGRGLDLSCLDEIVVARDYPQALLTIGEEIGRRIARTNLGEIQGGAQVIPLHQGQGLTGARLVMGLNLLLAPDRAGINAFHHELAHVADMSRKRHVSGWLTTAARGPEAIRLDVAGVLWDEYFADRTAAGTSPETLEQPIDVHLRFTLLADDSFQAVRLAAAGEVPTGFTPWPFAYSHLRNLWYLFALDCGRIDGLAEVGLITPEFQNGLTQAVCAAASASGLDDIAVTIWGELRRLYMTRFEWRDLSAYDVLCDLVDTSFSRLGFPLIEQAYPST